MGTKNGKWDGKGTPPSRKAASDWLRSQGLERYQIDQILPQGASLRRLGERSRSFMRDRSNPDGSFNVAKAIGGIPDALDRLLPGRMPAPSVSSGSRGTEGARPTASASGVTPEQAIQAAAEGDFGDLEEFLGGGPEASAESTRGAPLWPYDTSGMTPEEIGGITVADTSPMSAYGRRHRGPGGDQNQRVGARYYSNDSLMPLRWSPEKRAELQKLMHGLGLYGDAKVKLGTWAGRDQDVFTAVLEYSNVGGTRWYETLAGWKKVGLPPELEQKLKDSQPKRPTIQVTNPVDIRAAAQDVSVNLTGTRDDAFAQGAVGSYQSMEAGAQNAAYADQEGGGGGTVTQAPSLGAFAEDKLRREQPLEVDGYSFLGQFQNFLSMMGV